MSSSHRGPAAVFTGWKVFAWLAVLTIVEYVIAITVGPNLPALAVMGVVKAALIVNYFMHITRAWRGAGEEE